uniref:SEFIR domain-containing protein n=1 Tax=Neogobius melanostomus TaxID=47308 RepID=A0A8C6TZI6_9GOBI
MCSLEQPLSLRSIPPSSDVGNHTLSPYFCSPQGAPCCAQCPPEQCNRVATVNKPAWPQYHPGARPIYPGDFRLPGPAYMHMGTNIQAKGKTSLSAPLSLEQRRVFVTYEADSDKHVNEVINFVALLRHNGFDTHIDIFEQQFRSISKIDFMERYLSEKEYLIIIIISPKYHSTVTAPLWATSRTSAPSTLSTSTNSYKMNSSRMGARISALFQSCFLELNGVMSRPGSRTPTYTLGPGSGRHPAPPHESGEVQPSSHRRTAHHRVHSHLNTHTTGSDYCDFLCDRFENI